VPATAGGNSDDGAVPPGSSTVDDASMNGSAKLGSGGTPANPAVSNGGGGGTKLGSGNGGGWLSPGGGRGRGGGGGLADVRTAKGDGAGDVGGGGGDSKIGMGEAVAGEASEESALGAGEEAGVRVAPDDMRVKLASDGTGERRGGRGEGGSSKACVAAGTDSGVSECRAEGRGGNALARRQDAALFGSGASELTNVLVVTESSNIRRSLPPFASDTRDCSFSELERRACSYRSRPGHI